MVLAHQLQFFASGSILNEYEAVLRRAKFAIPPRMIGKSLRKMRECSKIVDPKRRLPVTRDPDDNRFLECAEAARADYLVTGNKRHFPKAWRQTLVVNARELIEWVAISLRR